MASTLTSRRRRSGERSYLSVNWSNPISDDPLNKDLRAWWLTVPHFRGPTWCDLLKLTYGTLTNGPTWQGPQGRPGGWGSLDHGTTGYAQSGALSSALQVPLPVTLAVWVNFTGTPSENAWIWGCPLTGNPFASWGLYCPNSGGLKIFGISNSAGSFYSAASNIAVSSLTGAWHHLAVVFRGDGTSIYLDGLHDNTVGSARSDPTYSPGPTLSMGFGSETKNYRTDDGRVWARAFSADEIYALYEDSRRGYPQTLRRIRRATWFVAGGGTTFEKSYSESIGHTDTYARLSDALRTYSESQGTTDTFTRISDALRVFVESLGITDAATLSKIVDRVINVIESLGASDTYSRLSDALRSTAENLGVQDTFSRLADALRIYSNSLGITDPAFNKTRVVDVSLPAEVIGISDAYTRVSSALRTFIETTGLTDAYTRTSAANRNEVDIVGITEAFTRLSDSIRTFSDLCGNTDVFARISSALRAYSETSGITDTYTRVSDANRTSSDTVGVSDTYARLSDANRDFLDNLGITDAATLQLIGQGVLVLAVSDLVGLSDTYSRVSHGNRNITDNLGTSETYVRLADALRVITDNLGFIDDPTLELIAAGAIALAVTDILGTQDAYARQANALRLLTDMIGLAEAIALFLATGVYPFVIDWVDFPYTQTDSQDLGYTVYDFIRFPGG